MRIDSARVGLVDPTCHTNEAFHVLVRRGGVAAANSQATIQAQQVNAYHASNVKDNTRYPGMEGESQTGNLKLEYHAIDHTDLIICCLDSKSKTSKPNRKTFPKSPWPGCLLLMFCRSRNQGGSSS